MKSKTKFSATCLSSLIMISAIAFLGCATSMSQGPRINYDRVVVKRSNQHTFTNVRVRETDSGYVLTGTVRHNHRNAEFNAHVDFAVVDSSGEVRYRASVPVSANRVRGRYRDSKIRIPIHGRYRDAKFEIGFPETLETGSTVQIAFHSVRPKRSPKFKCDDNQAAAMVPVNVEEVK